MSAGHAFYNVWYILHIVIIFISYATVCHTSIFSQQAQKWKKEGSVFKEECFHMWIFNSLFFIDLNKHLSFARKDLCTNSCPLLHHIGTLVLKFIEKEKKQHCSKNNWLVKFIFSLLRVIILWWIPIISLFSLTYNSQLVDMLYASPSPWSSMLCFEISVVFDNKYFWNYAIFLAVKPHHTLGSW